MSSVYGVGFNIAARTGLTSTGATYKRGISNDSSTPFTWDINVSGASNPNPYDGANNNSWNRSGSRLAWGSFWGRWTIDGQQTIGSGGIKLNDSSAAGPLKFIEFTGGNFPSNEDGGTEVTLGHNASNGKLDVIRPGLAESLLDGIDNTDAYFVLLDGSGTVQNSKRASNNGGPGPKWDWFSGGPQFGLGSNLEITNGGAGYDIAEVQVRINSTTGPTIMKDGSISVNFPNGATITFTTLEININGLA